MTEETTDADKKIAALERALIKAESGRGAAAAGCPNNPLMMGYLADRLRITFDDRGSPLVQAVGDKGGARWTVKNGKACGMTADDLAAEAIAEFPEVFPQSGKTGQNLASKQPENLTQSMLAERKRQQSAPLSDADRAALRAANPWRQGATWNFTQQMAIRRRNPGLADELKAAAGAA